MKLQTMLRPWKGDKRYTEIAKRAAALKKQRLSPDAIAATLQTEFGAPAELLRVRERALPFNVFGIIGDDIEGNAYSQLALAMRLPIAVHGALMPDAHAGFALPIGGVFAAHRAVSPAMVGVDIGCRMHLTVFAEPVDQVLTHRDDLFAILQAVTVFGAGGVRRKTPDHPIMHANQWDMTAQTRSLRDKAARQLGTSGSGNHFANLMIGERLGHDDLPQRFFALLTHSGSRGVGYTLARHFINVAAQATARIAHVPKMYEWLDLDSPAGHEYWAAMELAGNFAQANHEVIHGLFARQARLTPLHVVQNHHNFAWRNGDLVIHRKGATPAHHGEWGVIPGSMAAASYVVEGLGNPDSLNSASHGAGRVLSRSAARESINPKQVHQLLKQHDVVVQGLSVDESPLAYKDIERVLEIQIEADIVRPVARMMPVAVIMAGEGGDH